MSKPGVEGQPTWWTRTPSFDPSTFDCFVLGSYYHLSGILWVVEAVEAWKPCNGMAHKRYASIAVNAAGAQPHKQRKYKGNALQAPYLNSSFLPLFLSLFLGSFLPAWATHQENT